MDYRDLNFISENLSDVISGLRKVMNYVERKDVRLYSHLYACWDRLCNVQTSANRRLAERPLCPDPHNCKSWIEALSDVCKDCKYRR